MSNDPSSVPLSRVARALELIGLDVDTTVLRSVHIEAGCVTVVRKRLGGDGRCFILPGTNEVATDTVTIAVVTG